MDIIDRIDALVAEQIAAGESPGGYEDWSADPDPDYPRCECGRHWHGLPIIYNSQMICEGAEIIGPRRPRPTPAPRPAPHTGQIHMRIVIDQDSIRRTQQLFAGMRAEFARVGEVLVQFGGRMQVFMRRLEEAHGSLIFSGYSQYYSRPKPRTTPSTPAPKIEFGPKHWHHEIWNPHPPQFPRHGFYRSPLEWAVQDRWRELTVPNFPIPARPEMDFTHFDTDTTHGPTPRRRITDVPLPDPPATARAHRRHGRRHR